MNEEVGFKLFGESWFHDLRLVVSSPEFNALGNFIYKEREAYKVYPDKDLVFRAFKLTPPESLKCVIIGQAPYPNPTANGLAFAHNLDSKKIQPSLRKILDEVVNDVYEGFHPGLETDITLEHWAKQGVLLLNTALTVREGAPNSHSKNWEFFTKAVIQHINKNHYGTIWLLWGNNAKAFKLLITNTYHHVLEAGHPASGCYGKDLFSGCKHFSQVNKILEGINGKSNILHW